MLSLLTRIILLFDSIDFSQSIESLSIGKSIYTTLNLFLLMKSNKLYKIINCSDCLINDTSIIKFCNIFEIEKLVVSKSKFMFVPYSKTRLILNIPLSVNRFLNSSLILSIEQNILGFSFIKFSIESFKRVLLLKLKILSKFSLEDI